MFFQMPAESSLEGVGGSSSLLEQSKHDEQPHHPTKGKGRQRVARVKQESVQPVQSKRDSAVNLKRKTAELPSFAMWPSDSSQSSSSGNEAFSLYKDIEEIEQSPMTLALCSENNKKPSSVQQSSSSTVHSTYMHLDTQSNAIATRSTNSVQYSQMVTAPALYYNSYQTDEFGNTPYFEGGRNSVFPAQSTGSFISMLNSVDKKSGMEGFPDLLQRFPQPVTSFNLEGSVHDLTTSPQPSTSALNSEMALYGSAAVVDGSDQGLVVNKVSLKSTEDALPQTKKSRMDHGSAQSSE